MEKKYNIAVIGVTGLVGQELLSLLKKDQNIISSLHLFASKKSINKKILFCNTEIFIEEFTVDSLSDTDIAFFCVKKEIAKEIIPKVNKNVFCIDLSSAFRMDKNIPLIIPEINSHAMNNKRIISSPNCTTTIMLMAIHNLHKHFKIKRIIASTYQSASGGGKKLIDTLYENSEVSLKNKNTCFPYGFNLFLHDSYLKDNKYSEEEEKLLYETRKILEDDEILVSATCVRVPVIRCHSMSLNIEFANKFSLKEIYSIVNESEGVEIFEDYSKNKFATPFDASNNEKVLVSRIRLDNTKKNTIELWVVGDQLLKGAALNAYQIAKTYIYNNLMQEA